jgi:hypothetical protein
MLLTFNVPFWDRAATFALETAAETGAELLVCDGVPIAAGQVASIATRYYDDTGGAEASAALARAATARGVRVRQFLFHHPRPVRAALEVARDRQVGLLVFGPDPGRYGRWRWRRAARKVRQGAPCLVWTGE